MAQNISLWGANYTGVTAVDLPKTGGGTARFIDMDVLNPVDITSRCTINSSVIRNAKVMQIHRLVLISGLTKTNIDGVNVTAITLPYSISAQYAWFYVGGYGSGFVGEGTVIDRFVKMNISSSTNNGNFSVATVVDLL